MDETIKTQLSRARALIFDCDGTLIKSGGLYANAWGEAFSRAGQPIRPDWYHHRSGLSDQLLMDAFEAQHGLTLDRDLVVQDMRNRYFADIDSLKVFPEVLTIARAWHGKLPMAVATGGARDVVMPSLLTLGILALFDVVVTVDDVEQAKPAPDLFLKAADQLKVNPEDCLVFEDSPQGLEAAMRANMPVIDVAKLMTDEASSFVRE